MVVNKAILVILGGSTQILKKRCPKAGNCVQNILKSYVYSVASAKSGGIPAQEILNYQKFISGLLSKHGLYDFKTLLREHNIGNVMKKVASTFVSAKSGGIPPTEVSNALEAFLRVSNSGVNKIISKFKK